jgi:RNA polymerase sigma-70 factor (ECF subfamily)
MNQDLTNYKQEEATMTEAAFQTISAVLNELSCKQRAVVLFMWGFGYTAKETAGLLSVSEGSVKAALNRARKNIKRINFTNDFFEHDEDKSIPFIDALRNENPEAILRLYQKEIKEPFMQFSNRNHPISSSSLTVQTIGAGSTPYMLISIPKKNGGVLFVPFYQLELSALLSQIAWVEQKEFLAVA